MKLQTHLLWKCFPDFLFNGEFYTRKVLSVTYEDFDWHCVFAWISLHKLSRCWTAHFELSQSLARFLTTWESTGSFYCPYPRRVESQSTCIFNHKGSTFSYDRGFNCRVEDGLLCHKWSNEILFIDSFRTLASFAFNLNIDWELTGEAKTVSMQQPFIESIRI